MGQPLKPNNRNERRRNQALTVQSWTQDQPDDGPLTRPDRRNRARAIARRIAQRDRKKEGQSDET